ncbi:hypothetical protein C4K05_5417 [Pseudomonas chlororaphis subsp. aureofaciens]|uniref:Uncharacterized protein n=1 Tax=Pseudomonas chlororaphis subsp. aureofaciens TaxID=587851 RepID=A0AAD0ZNG8_9PSED|nr:hypothetical protein C4K08_5425 [Pseudomonas chlororaphis subsp. aureofaciens]AZE32095.1 hypothetical protein C4K07_5336 [Pseudomonas chlororaphis subsp. aureofaciens]AZE38374.1 hypothetical protein C4K06_5367 [Pseudomonas chlororaphis subsp. aureofaciens]AZE44731.1 hypothetical protein C4K05_5417 [Pseudomonas chlororaphis subsp. aureofaciens]
MRRRGFVYVAPVAAAEHREAAINRETGAALELAEGPADLSQPAAAATPIACTELSGCTSVAAAEPARLRSTAQRAPLLGAQEVLRTYRSLRQRLHRLRVPNYRVVPCSRCRACEAAIDRAAGAALGCAGGPADLSQPSAAATPIACTELSGCPPVAAAEHREAAIACEAGAALGRAGGPSDHRSLRQRLHRLRDRAIGAIYSPVAAAEHREAAIDREAGAALGLAEGPADLSQPSAAATPIACTELSGYPL